MLEDRLAPATLNIAGSVLTYTGALGEFNQLTITATPSNGVTNYTFQEALGNIITLSGSAMADGWTGNNNSLVSGTDATSGPLTLYINLGDGNDALHVNSYQTAQVGTSLNIVKSGGGREAITLGRAGSLPLFTNPVNVFNPGGAIVSLTVDDSGDSFARSWNVGPNLITGVGSPIMYAGVSSVTLQASSQGSNFLVTDTSSPTTIVGASSSDSATVRGTTAPLTFQKFASVTLGSNSGLQSLDGTVTISQGNTLTIDDTHDSSGRNVTFNATSVAGLAPADINYDTTLTSLAVTGSDAGNNNSNQYTVTGVAVPTTLSTGKIQRGSSVYVLATSQPLTIDAQAPADSIVLGNAGFVQGLHGAVTINNQASNQSVLMDDSADPASAVATISGSSVTGLAAGFAGVTFTGVRLGTLGVRDGGGASTLVIDPVSTPQIARTIQVAGSGSGSLLVDDTGDSTGQTLIVGTGSITGYVPEIDFVGSQWTGLALRGSGGGNTITVTGTSTPTAIDCGPGADTLTVRGTLAPLTINGQGGADSVGCGFGGTVQGLLGPVTVTNVGGRTWLTVDDGLDPIGQNATVTANGITGLAPAVIRYSAGQLSALTVLMGTGSNTLTLDDSTDTSATNPLVSSVTVQFLFPMPVNYAGRLATLNVLGGSGGNFWTIMGTSVPTFIGAGTSTDNVLVLATTAPLTINGESGVGDADYLGYDPAHGGGPGSVQGLGGTVTIDNPGGGATLVIGEMSDPKPRDALFTNASISGLGAAPIRYTASQFSTIQFSCSLLDSLTVNDSSDPVGRPARIDQGIIAGLIGGSLLYPSGLASLTVLGGPGENAFDVGSLDAKTLLQLGSGADQVDVYTTNNEPLTIDAGGGCNTITFGSAGGLVGLTSPVLVFGSGASTTLVLDDSGNPANENVTLGSNILAGSILPQGGSLTYANVGQLVLLLGGGNHNVDVSGFTGSATISGSGNDTVTANGNANFTLTDSLLTRSGRGGNASIELSGFSNASLTAAGPGDHTMNAMGFSGNVSLTGGTGNDWLIGGSGHSVLSGGLGTNTLIGGSGPSSLVESADDSFTLTNTLLTGMGTTPLSDVLMNIGSANLSDPNNAPNAPGRKFNASAFTGNVTLIGGAGNDTLQAGRGTSVLSGGLGVNTLTGGPGTNEVTEALTGSFLLTNTSLVGYTGLTSATGVAIRDTLTGSFRLANLTDTDSTNTGRSLNATAFTGNVTLTGGPGTDTLLGGSGNDSLDGGSGDNILVGGRGKNTLSVGGAGRNLLIGGAGTSALLGGGGDDLLIAGTTRFTTRSINLLALNAIMAEWTSTDSYAVRIACLTGTLANGRNGTVVLSPATVSTAGHVGLDTVTGGLGSDWFFDQPTDLITDAAGGETLNH
jgi:hypothetical protein